MEWLYHLGVPVDEIEDIAENSCNTVPVMMPYVTAFFMPRQAGDRPDVVPKGAVNFAFLGQFAETKRDTIFTTEYSVRTGMEAVYMLLDIDRGVPEVWGSTYDIRDLLNATIALRDGKPLTYDTGLLANAAIKPMLKEIHGTDIEKLLLRYIMVFTAVPDLSANLIGRLFGAVTVLFGVIKLIGYFSKDLYRLAFQFDLALGIMMIILGGIMLVNPNNVLNVICVGVGIYILLDGLLKIQIAMDSRRFGLSKWWLIMTAAAATGIVGLMLIIRPDEGVRFATVMLGISLIFEGILNLITVLTAVKIISGRLHSDDIIDIELNDD